MKNSRRSSLGRMASAASVSAFALIAVVTVWVEREAPDQRWTLSGSEPARALVLFHPSRDAGFSDDLSIAVGQGLNEGGFSVDRMTTTSHAPNRPGSYRVVVIVSSVYFWTPDRPTLRYLQRARFEGIPTVGLIAGAGSTGRAERLLRNALVSTGASSVSTHSFWLVRPNDEERTTGSNRQVALDRARFLGRCLAKLLGCPVV